MITNPVCGDTGDPKAKEGIKKELNEENTKFNPNENQFGPVFKEETKEKSGKENKLIKGENQRNKQVTNTCVKGTGGPVNKNSEILFSQCGSLVSLGISRKSLASLKII